MPPLNELSITQARDGLKKKDFSSEELTRACFNQIYQVEEKVGAFLSFNEESALETARKVDSKIKNGEEIGPIEGIPAAIKDNILVKDLPCTAGSKILENYKAVYDATVVQKLKKAGAIILGKTNMDEFAMGSSTENSAYHLTRNPRNLNYIPGGSSGGSAAAVAADECIFALGSDTGGSIRQPASLCGIVGLKPTYGSVSRYGLIAMASSLDVIGPLTKTVEDARTVFETIKGRDIKDATTMESEISTAEQVHYRANRNQESGIKDLRIGIPKEYFIEGMDLITEKSVHAAIKKLETHGAKLIEISLPHAEYALAVYYILMPAEVSANLARFDGIRYGYSKLIESPPNPSFKLYDIYAKSRAHGFGSEVKRRIMLGAYVLSAGYRDAYYNQAQKARALIKTDFDKAFKEVNCVLCPTSPTPAWRIGERIENPLTMYLSDIYTISANLVGIPSISVPCGNAAGLPIGVQLMTQQCGEDILFKISGFI